MDQFQTLLGLSIVEDDFLSALGTRTLLTLWWNSRAAFSSYTISWIVFRIIATVLFHNKGLDILLATVILTATIMSNTKKEIPANHPSSRTINQLYDQDIGKARCHTRTSQEIYHSSPCCGRTSHGANAPLGKACSTRYGKRNPRQAHHPGSRSLFFQQLHRYTKPIVNHRYRKPIVIHRYRYSLKRWR